MPLPPLPDKSGPNPAPEFVGTGRIYYPIPFASRLITLGKAKIHAELEDLLVNVSFKNGKVDQTEMAVNYSYMETDGTRAFSEMDLNKWQKLPPVPHP